MIYTEKMRKLHKEELVTYTLLGQYCALTKNNFFFILFKKMYSSYFQLVGLPLELISFLIIQLF